MPNEIYQYSHWGCTQNNCGWGSIYINTINIKLKTNEIHTKEN